MRNKIRHTVKNPLTDENSEFYVPPEKRSSYFGKMLSIDKKNPLFKRAKYVVVIKTSESKNVYRLYGTNRRTRNYAIAILTDDNRYYYNEYTSKHTVLSTENVNNLIQLFTSGYIIDGNTRVVCSDNIKNWSEPIMIFLRIVMSVLSRPIMVRSTTQMISFLNNQFGYMKRVKSGDMKGGYIGMFKKALLDYDRFDFLPPDVVEKMTSENETAERRRKIFYTSLGLLYLHYMSIKSERNKSFRDAQKQKNSK
jgi:hypothetical protein